MAQNVFLTESSVTGIIYLRMSLLKHQYMHLKLHLINTGQATLEYM